MAIHINPVESQQPTISIRTVPYQNNPVTVTSDTPTEENLEVNTITEVDTFINNLTDTDDIIITKNGRTVTIGSKHYVHTQAVASDTWVIEHNLNKIPNVKLIDSAGSIYYPAVEYNNENKCTLHLIGAMAGTAYLD